MQTPTISKKQAKNTLSGKKKKPTEIIKNVLVQPFKSYWPKISTEDNNHLVETLKKFLPRLKPIKTVIPYSTIKNVPKEERKDFRKNLNQNNFVDNKLEEKNIIFGVNDVTKSLENQEVGSILISSSVQPRLFVQHVLDQAVLYQIPVLIVSDLKAVFEEKCGICGSVVGFKKTIKPDSELGLIHQAICNIAENYPRPKNHINSQRSLNISTITINDSEDERVPVVNVIEEEMEETKNFHLKRINKNQRVFIPGKEIKEEIVGFINLDNSPTPKRMKVDNTEKEKIIDLDSTCELTPKRKKVDNTKKQYRSVRVNRFKGNKNRNKRKMSKIKKAHTK